MALIENLFVLGVLGLSGGFIFLRIRRISQGKSDQSIGGGCAACSSGTCTPTTGETPLKVKSSS